MLDPSTGEARCIYHCATEIAWQLYTCNPLELCRVVSAPSSCWGLPQGRATLVVHMSMGSSVRILVLQTPPSPSHDRRWVSRENCGRPVVLLERKYGQERACVGTSEDKQALLPTFPRSDAPSKRPTLGRKSTPLVRLLRLQASVQVLKRYVYCLDRTNL